MTQGDRHPCPCCGRRSLDEGPGSYAVCPICFWEDDYDQLLWPTLAGGANETALITAQLNYATVGACHPELVTFVRRPGPSEPPEPEWRRATGADDIDEAEFDIRTVHLDPTLVYYWRRRAEA